MFCVSAFSFEPNSKYPRTRQNQHFDEGDLIISLTDLISLQISETWPAAAHFCYWEYNIDYR